ncbi:hypothetical protein PQS31_14095 [Luteimonas sp BLCC-B24]|uniref:hypothetical protein n=1 Tax=Luteimonas sp. BLCC-B24 TaxID=3025317 RepID=UPI00234C20E8|nr:hypothetical protein [Luteimonas sp. BLCC-B24]MDC7807941.1 hypothetical protein [Luteimonas sp. BLCC-B24]
MLQIREIRVASGARAAVVFLMALPLLVTACQRPPADPSGVGYQVVDETTSLDGCVICVVAAPRARCTDATEAAELRWNVPAGLRQGHSVAIEIERQAGAREVVARGGFSGHVLLRQAVSPGDRIRVVGAADAAPLLQTDVDTSKGCEIQTPGSG